jgi:hypothetical protein
MKKEELGGVGKFFWPLHQGSKVHMQNLFGVFLGILALIIARKFISTEAWSQEDFIFYLLAWIAGGFGLNTIVDRGRDIFSPAAKIYAQGEVDEKKDKLTEGK